MEDMTRPAYPWWMVQAAGGTVLSYIALTAMDASAPCVACGSVGGGMLAVGMARLAGSRPMLPLHWLMLAGGTMLAATVLVLFSMHAFNPAMFALCPFCGQTL